MELNTHYELDESFVGFYTDLLSFSDDVVLYDGVPVVAANGSRIVDPGSVVQGRKISTQQAISLWQHCYTATRVSYDPEQCARVYRNVNHICHTCCGDKSITRWVKEPDSRKRVPKEVECTDCDGTGHNNDIQYEEDVWQSQSS